ncbi:hypothetical protein LJ656_05005 [Paraburkholderia sp. MMS20-SJTR3]|uniref:Uncharacterized protein n=1 Tax=Paraburkholderia sejongensis TaxID=2886946 RepID=A0ABS8JPW1_9BURK|nr:hypothetical protein [Paraburkholderia sp. MMS20-SJTR3]MCC8391939.1 hypothetical protein [Paraburkholderia sp. MMS20-SJTR3]
MIQMMMAIAGNGASATARNVEQIVERHRHAWLLRKTFGCAIVAGGFAVLGAQAWQRLLGG